MELQSAKDLAGLVADTLTSVAYTSAFMLFIYTLIKKNQKSSREDLMPSELSYTSSKKNLISARAESLAGVALIDFMRMLSENLSRPSLLKKI